MADPFSDRRGGFTPLEPTEIEDAINEYMAEIGPFNIDQDDDDDDFDIDNALRRRESPVPDDDDDDEFARALEDEEDEELAEKLEEQASSEGSPAPARDSGSKLSMDQVLNAIGEGEAVDPGPTPEGFKKSSEQWTPEDVQMMESWLSDEGESDIPIIRGGGFDPRKDALTFVESLSRSFLETFSTTADLPEWLDTDLVLTPPDASYEASLSAAAGEAASSGLIIGGATLAGAKMGGVPGAVAGAAAGSALSIVQGSRREALAAKEEALYLGMDEESAERVGDRMFYMSLGIETLGTLVPTGFILKPAMKKANGAVLKEIIDKSVAKTAGDVAVEVAEKETAQQVAGEVLGEGAVKASKEFGTTSITIEGAEQAVDVGAGVLREELNKVAKTSLAVKYASRLANSKAASGSGLLLSGAAEESTQYATSEGLIASEFNDSSFVDEFTDNLFSKEALQAAVGGAFGEVVGGGAGRFFSEKAGRTLEQRMQDRLSEEALSLIETEAKGAEISEKEKLHLQQVAAIDKAISVLTSDVNDINQVVIDTPGITKEVLQAAIGARQEGDLYISTIGDEKGPQQLVLKRAEPVEPVDIVERSLNEEKATLLKELEEADKALQSGRALGALGARAGDLAARDTLVSQVEEIDKSLEIVTLERELRDNNRRLSKLTDRIARNPNDSEDAKSEVADLVEANKQIRDSLKGRVPDPVQPEPEPAPKPRVPRNNQEILQTKQRRSAQELFDKELETAVADLDLGQVRAQHRKLAQLDRTDILGAPAQEGQLSEPGLRQRFEELSARLQQEEEARVAKEAQEKTEAETQRAAREQLVRKQAEEQSRKKLQSVLTDTDPLDLIPDEDNPDRNPNQIKKELKALVDFEKRGFELSPEEAQRYQDLSVAQDLYSERASQEAEAKETAERERLAAEREEQEAALQDFEDERTIFSEKGYRNLSPEIKKHVPRNATLSRLRRSLETAKSEPRRQAIQQAIDLLEDGRIAVVKRDASPTAPQEAEGLAEQIATKEEELKEVQAQRSFAQSQPDFAPERQDLPALEKRAADLQREIKQLKAEKRRRVVKTPKQKTKREKLEESFRIFEEMAFDYDKADNIAHDHNPATGNPFLEDASFLVYHEEGRAFLSQFLEEEFTPPSLGHVMLTPEEAKTVEKTIKRDAGDTSNVISPRAVKFALHKVGKTLTDRIRFEHKKFDKPGLLGLFNKVSLRIQTLKHSANAVLAHEVGHAMWQTFVGTGKFSVDRMSVNPKAVAELTQMARALYPKLQEPSGQLTEGFAEFFRHYVTDKDGIERLQKSAPETMRLFREQMLPSIPGLAEAVETAAKYGRIYDALPPLQRTQAHITAYNYVPIQQKFQEGVNRLIGLSKTFVRAHYDQHAALHWTDAKIAKLAGELPDSKKLGKVMDASRRHADAIATSFLRRRPVDKYGTIKPGAMNFIEAFSPIQKAILTSTPEQKKLYTEVLNKESKALELEKKLEITATDLRNLEINQIPGDATPAKREAILKQVAKDKARLHQEASALRKEITKLQQEAKRGRAQLPKRVNRNARRLLNQWLFAQRTLQEDALHKNRMDKWVKAVQEYQNYEERAKKAKAEHKKKRDAWVKSAGKDEQGNPIPEPRLPEIKRPRIPGPRPEYKETGIPPEQARKTIDEIDRLAPEVAIAGRAIEIWFEGVLKTAGSFSPVLMKKILAMREINGTEFVYVPLVRAYYDNQVDATKARIGSDAELGDPIKGLYRVAHAFLQMGINQQRMDLVAELGQDPRLHSIITPVDNDHMKKILKQAGIDKWEDFVNKQAEKYQLQFGGEAEAKEMATGMLDTLLQRTGLIQLTDDIQGVAIPIHEWDESTGKYNLRMYSMSKELADSLVGVDPDALKGASRFFKTLGELKVPGTEFQPLSDIPQMFKLGVTGASIAFVYGSNIFIDIPAMLINSRSDANWVSKLSTWAGQMISLVSHAVLPESARKTLAAASPDGVSELFDNEAFLAFLYGSSIDQSAFLTDERSTEKYLKRLSRGGVSRVLNIPGSGLDFITEFFKAPEMAPRATEVKLLAKKMGIDFTQPLTADQFVALTTAGKDITVDFTRAGTFARIYNQIKPFWNPAFQGTLTDIRAFKRNPGQYVSRSLVFAGMSLYAWSKIKDKDWYKEYQSPYKYMFNWFEMKDKDGNTVVGKIRHGHMSAFFFQVLPKMYLDGINDKDPEMASQIAEVFFQNLLPINLYKAATGTREQKIDIAVGALPHVVTALSEVYGTERDSFTGADLVGPFEKASPGSPPYKVFKPYSTRAARWLSENVLEEHYPAEIEHLMQKTFGNVGVNIIHSVEFAAGLKSDVDKHHAKNKGYLTSWQRAFLQPGGEYPARSRSISELYLNSKALEAMRSEEDEEGDPRQIRLQTNDARQAIKMLTETAHGLSDVKKINEIRKMAIDIAREANKAVDEAYIDRELFKEHKAYAKEIKELYLGKADQE